MNKLRKMLTAFTLCLALTLALPMSTLVVHATEDGTETTSESSGFSSNNNSTGDTGSAIKDILSNARFEGAISSISKITDFVDIWFIRIISLVSFFIISAALLKNVCAGAYCANSKFWDKVADAHQKTEAVSLAGVKNFFAGGQGVMNTSVGGVRDFLLGIVPNIKAFTDFEDADIEPKAYFMKAIPQMIACVIIGIFIYNGYYRDTAATVGEMGSVLIERTLGSVNPESFINKIFNTTSWPKFPWDGDSSKEGEWKQSIAKEFKSLVASNATDISSSQQKSAVVSNIVKYIQTGSNISGNLKTYWDGSAEGCEGGNYEYDISGISSYVSAAMYDADMCEVDDSDLNNVLVNISANMKNFVSGSTTLSDETSTCYVTFTLKRKASDGATTDGSSSVVTDGFGATTSGSGLTIANTTVQISASEYGLTISNGIVTSTGQNNIPLSLWTGTTSGYTFNETGTDLKVDYDRDKGVLNIKANTEYSVKETYLIGRIQRSTGGAAVDVYLEIAQ